MSVRVCLCGERPNLGPEISSLYALQKDDNQFKFQYQQLEHIDRTDLTSNYTAFPFLCWFNTKSLWKRIFWNNLFQGPKLKNYKPNPRISLLKSTILAYRSSHKNAIHPRQRRAITLSRATGQCGRTSEPSRLATLRAGKPVREHDGPWIP